MIWQRQPIRLGNPISIKYTQLIFKYEDWLFCIDYTSYKMYYIFCLILPNTADSIIFKILIFSPPLFNNTKIEIYV